MSARGQSGVPMEEHVSSGKTNYFFTIIRFILFVIIFCFIVTINRYFFKELKTVRHLNVDVFFVSILSAFAFYAFLADLNNFYKKVQKFFFHGTLFSYLVPSLMVLAGLGYLILPKLFNVRVDYDIFVFVGGFSMTMHLIYAARETRGTNFSGFINYLFYFSLLYLEVLLLFSLYLMAVFTIHLDKIFIEGIKQGFYLIQDLFTQISH